MHENQWVYSVTLFSFGVNGNEVRTDKRLFFGRGKFDHGTYDSDFVMDGSQPLDPRKTILLGEFHLPFELVEWEK